MKKTILSFLIIGIVCLIKVNAQNPVTTLQHNGTTQVYYGQSSFSDALGAAVNGDTLVLSAGFFTAPTSISKGVKVYGSGHFPDSANIPKRTTIMGGLNINAGADSLRLEGLFINGNINYAAASSINYVNVIRCRLGNALFNSTSATASKNFCSYEESVLNGGINFNNYGTNFCVTKCIFDGASLVYKDNVSYMEYYSSIANIAGGALIKNNISIVVTGGYNETKTFIGRVSSSIIEDNIIFNTKFAYETCIGNQILYNIFISNSIYFNITNNNSNNYYYGNYLNTLQNLIFINQTGNTFDYSHNYHLQNPSQYLGTDGTQVGIYGGTTPFKEKGAASNPQITNRNIATQTDVNGNLQINISVKAQDR